MRRERYETNIERILRVELESRGYRKGIDFATQFPIKNSFILDFAFPEQKVAIEADGEAWHTSKDARKRDNFKNYILKKKGWLVLRFWGEEIENRVEDCVDMIVRSLS